MTDTRVGHVKADPTDTYVGRGTSGQTLLTTAPGHRGWLGNPFTLEDYDRADSITRYRRAFEDKLCRDSQFREAVAELAGETLGCWCQRLSEDSPACHGEVIAEWADRLAADGEAALDEAQRVIPDGGETSGEFPVSSSATDIAESRVDELQAHPGRTAQISHHAGEHPYVRYNPATETFERASLADGRNSAIEVEELGRAELIDEMAGNPVVVKPLAEPDYYVGDREYVPVWQLVAEGAEPVERVGGEEIVTDGGRTVATNRTSRDASIDDEPRWRFEWANIRDGCGVFVR